MRIDNYYTLEAFGVTELRQGPLTFCDFIVCYDEINGDYRIVVRLNESPNYKVIHQTRGNLTDLRELNKPTN